MKFNSLIKFEPIDLTHIAITFGLALIIIYSFKAQLNDFFDTLQDRPITVTMSGSETRIELDSPVKPTIFTESIFTPQGTEQDVENWEHTIASINDLDQVPKQGFGALYTKLSELNKGDHAVLSYAVDNPNKLYFQDVAMLKYLSVASSKIGYLAFYKDNRFVGMINIQAVISGLASKDVNYRNFGDKIKNGQWANFSALIAQQYAFKETPSVKVLYNKLSDSGLTEIPLLKDGRLIGLLNFKSISDELYTQVSQS